MELHAIKINKVARMWGLVLALGLAAGVFGVWRDGWHTGDTIGLIVWFIILLGVLSLVRRQNRE
jgi:predicted HAD superfamily phosphohydrolase